MTSSIDLPAQIDFRFAWRWLLPVTAGDKVMLLGFSTQETAFWSSIFGVNSLTNDPANATFLLVKDTLPDSADVPLFDNLRAYCAVGPANIINAWQEWNTENFPVTREYALLEPRNPRIVVPLGNSAWIGEGLMLHRPGRRTARAALWAVKALSRFGFDKVLRKRVLRIASVDANSPPQGSIRAGLPLSNRGAPADFALYLGAPGDNRKTVILPLGGKEKSILKTGQSVEAKAALINEATAIKSLSRTAIANRVPQLLKVVRSEHDVTLHLSYRRRKAAKANFLQNSVGEFLVALSHIDRAEHPLEEILDQMPPITSVEVGASTRKAHSALSERLTELAASGQKIIGHRSHGDFAPWNCSWTEQGLFVFDWEESQQWDTALVDAFYFILAPVVHVSNSADTTALIRRATTFFEGVATAAGLDTIDSRLYLSLWLLNCLCTDPKPIYGQLLEKLALSWK